MQIADMIRRQAGLFIAFIGGLLCLGLIASGDTIYWSGGGTDRNWTTAGSGGNWSGSAMPQAGDTAVFTHLGGGNVGVVTNVLPASHTISILSYQLDSSTPTAFNHTTQLASGQTLLLTGGLQVSPASVGSAGNTQWHGKTFPINISIIGASGATLQVGSTGTSPPHGSNHHRSSRQHR